MDSTQAWQVFMKTGEVEAYLVYKNLEQQPKEPTNKDVYNAYKSKGNSAPQNSGIGK